MRKFGTMPWCQVPGCLARREGKQKARFFRIPTESHLKSRWIHRIRRQGWKPNKDDAICALHFAPVCIFDCQYSLIEPSLAKIYNSPAVEKLNSVKQTLHYDKDSPFLVNDDDEVLVKFGFLTRTLN